MKENTDWKERFRAVYAPLLGDGYDAFENALSSPRGRHVRIAETRGARYVKELSQSASLSPLEGYRGVYSVKEGGENITSSLSFQTGGAYIMNPSSVVPAQILASAMPENPLMLDVSAAPGGKTCALSDYTGRRGAIVANELSSSRLKSLHFNLEKYGCYDVKTVSMDGRLLGGCFKDVFDGVLLDAPCSNENKIFRDKTVQAQWGRELVERMAALQKQLMASAFSCLAPGGTLVYSTCTMSLEENELAVKYLLDTQKEAELAEAAGFSGTGLSGISEIDGKVARIMPSPSSADGFFTAVIRKKGEPPRREPAERALTERQKSFFKEHFTKIPGNINVTEAENRGYAETMPGAFPGICFKRRGLNIYRIAGKNAEPTAQGLWEFGGYAAENIRTEVSRKEAEAYLKGFDLPLTAEYKGKALFCEGLALGPVKPAQGVLKNKLDRYFLYGKNIEW